MKSILLLHFFSCIAMTGIIWLVQVLIYPSFQRVGRDEFEVFHSFHMKRITWVVAPLMAIELLTAAGLIYFTIQPIYILNFVLVIFLWLFTAFKNVPLHNRLQYSSSKSKADLARLKANK